MTESDKPVFFSSFAEWVSLYPSATGVHEGTSAAYWSHLRAMPLDVVRRALLIATKQSPTYLPSAEMLRQIAEPLAKQLRDAQRPAQPLLGASPHAAGLPPDHPALVCARAIEADIREQGLTGEARTTDENAIRWCGMIEEATSINIAALRKKGTA